MEELPHHAAVLSDLAVHNSVENECEDIIGPVSGVFEDGVQD